MNNFVVYSIEIAISLTLFYIAYWVFLKNETFFKLNRFYLMFSVAVSLLTPLINITVGEDSFISRNLILPIEQYEQSIIGNIDHKHIPTTNEIIIFEDDKNTLSKKEVGVNKSGSTESNALQTIPLNSIGANISYKKTNWLTVALAIYFIGVALFLIRFMANFIWIFGYVLKHKRQQILGMKVIRYEKNISPFSFLNFIFISNKEYPEAELTKIISHEKVHIKQKHTIDLILFELLLVLQWFNPFVWFYKNAVRINHEYLADIGTLHSGVDLPGYQYSLLNQVLLENNFEIASSYNFSVKKRIAMMMKKRSSKLSVLKLIIPLPIFIFLFSAFAFCTSSSEKDVNYNEVNKLIADQDTSIKRVNVPIEYLKQLEGEYVSTNQPSWVRKIKFVVVLGELVGNDNGYRYKIIPIGDGKFINPDDHASLVFDTKDKNAISLLLFGKINLTKVKVSQELVDFPKKSVAYLLANKMAKDGITAALAYYKEVKDSSNYDLNIYEMNLAGNLFLQSGRAKEACSIFKLNTEAFPNTFKVYDSYGDALMVLGNKTQAIDIYKKSLRLNPGSKNGIKRLKELGVNTDTLIKKVKVPIEYLKLLEGEYISTNQPNWVRKIKFVELLGVLLGNDNGYRFKLIPMGDGKFINPDDGESLVFDTKDKNTISLLLFGTTNLKKLKEPVDFPKKSIAYLLANKMAKDGITAALAYYKEIKDSSNYDLNEHEMNFAGYELLQSGNAKEASSMFKLNVEAFPDSWNVYDSYADALMALGAKTQAVENYKKSVQLNPGNKSGIKRLKELGVNTDDLIKKVEVSMEYLKQLEGDYFSTNEPNRSRTIKFVVEEGVLVGNDNGYRYKLIPLGDGKFINPEDGVSLVFNAKDKNAITLLLAGTINLKKFTVKIPKEKAINMKKDSIIISEKNLLKYCGEYMDDRMIGLSLFLKGEHIYRHMYNGAADARLIPISLNMFIYDDDTGRIMEFNRHKNGEVLSLTISSTEGDFTYNRKK